MDNPAAQRTSRRALVLFSGGLDSQLAVRILQTQGVDVVALNLQTIFTSGPQPAERAAERLGIPLVKISAGDDYLDVVRAPRFGYGQGANPCLDCRIYLLRRAVSVLHELHADFLATGDVVGQRLMGQKRRDLDIIAFHGGCEDLLLRPLSALRLPTTKPEREGWVDRARLYNFSGTGRRKLIALARRLGIEEIPPQTPGCQLVEKHFAAKVHELVQLAAPPTVWDYELLRIGRHLRYDHQTKAVVGRNAAENDALAAMAARDDRGSTLITPENFRGPTALVVGQFTPLVQHWAVGRVVRYTHDPRATHGRVIITRLNANSTLDVPASIATNCPASAPRQQL